MTDRHTADTITSDALDALYESLDAAQETELSRQLRTADAAFASATVRAAKAEAAVARVRAVAERWRYAGDRKGGPATELLAALDEPGPAPTQATDAETTTRVFAALHRSAEDTVTRVINLHEQWVKAGPPPLGASLARWWDKRLAELHQAIRPPAPTDDAPAGPITDRPFRSRRQQPQEQP